MKWIRTANLKKYNVVAAFEEFDTICWKKSNFNIDIGDIVYIYVGKPLSKIMYKTVCIDTGILNSDARAVKDFKYWENGQEPTDVYECIELKLLNINNSDSLTIQELNELKLVDGNIQGAYRDNNYPDLFEYINTIFTKNINKEQFIDGIELNLGSIQGLEKERIIKARVNQSYYRELLKQRYDSCCLCGVNNYNFLIASHIKPWSVSSAEERIDIDNGFLLCPNHDKLFDQGWISFEDSGRIMISDQMDSVNELFMNINANMNIDITNGNKKYLKYHRENIFIK